jgi:hypothetical protein
MVDQRNVTLAVTGAGGTRMARFVLESLVKDDHIGRVDLMVSRSRLAPGLDDGQRTRHRRWAHRSRPSAKRAPTSQSNDRENATLV